MKSRATLKIFAAYLESVFSALAAVRHRKQPRTHSSGVVLKIGASLDVFRETFSRTRQVFGVCRFQTLRCQNVVKSLIWEFQSLSDSIVLWWSLLDKFPSQVKARSDFLLVSEMNKIEKCFSRGSSNSSHVATFEVTLPQFNQAEKSHFFIFGPFPFYFDGHAVFKQHRNSPSAFGRDDT